jgi:hypothetical protein
MKRIIAEGTEFIYFCKNEQPPLENEIIEEMFVEPFSANSLHGNYSLIDYSDMRVIVSRNPLRKKSCILYYLHWDNNQNLDKLDMCVETNKFSDEDFKHSIKTFLHQITCLTCKNQYVALSVPSGDVYIASWELMNEKIKCRNYLVCPNCKSSLRQMVVKIF